jgi:pimeloyl-ACP methyl ester carboxylesterase
MLALEWASRYPAECAGIVVMNTSLAGVSPFYDRLRLLSCRQLAAQILLGRDIRARESAVLKLTSNGSSCPESLLDQWASFAQDRPVRSINVLWQLGAAMRYRGPPTEPNVPVLVLAGQGDRLVSSKCSVRIARRWALPLAVHASAGHDLALDAADWVCEEICCWLGRY